VSAAILAAACGLWAAGPAYASHLYLSDFGSSRVFPFSFSADGSLTPVNCPGSGCIGSAQSQGVAVSPNGQFLYVASVNDTVSPFAVAADGSLTPITCSGSDCSTGPNPTALAVSPNGRFVYVTNANNPGSSPGSVSPFTIGSDGSLSPVACPGSNCSTGLGPRGVAVTPDGRFLYVANVFSDTVSPFAIGSDGSLTPIACSGSRCATGSFPTAVSVSPNGRFLYVVNGGLSGTVSPFAIGSDGSLTPISCNGDDCAAAVSSNAIAISPDGRFLYVAGGGIPANVSVSAIAADGSLTPVPCPGSDCVGGTDPGGVVVSPSGRFLYMVSEEGPDFGMISVFAIGADGLLSAVSCPGSNCSTGAAPFFQPLAISPDQAPTAAFSARAAPPGKPMAFDGSASTAAPGQTVARYAWNFGDGTTVANGGPRPTHVYAAVGHYKVTLTVTDNAGCSTTLVFTGQTASCNGGPTATRTLMVSVAKLPTVHIIAPGVGARYIVGQIVHANFSCTDGTGGTGIASCTGTVANGARLGTARPGPHRFTVIATSRDGLTSAVSVPYTVFVPSNRFTVTHLKVHPNGQVEFDVTVPYAGQLDVLETNWEPSPPATNTVLLKPGPHRYAFARRHLDLARAGTTHLTVTPSARGGGQIRHHYRPVRINLWITYQPNGGHPRTIGFISLFVTK
jgi:DNA-binding beta-propeller fold protein YncE